MSFVSMLVVFVIHADLMTLAIANCYFFANCSYVVLLYHCLGKWRVEGSQKCLTPPKSVCVCSKSWVCNSVVVVDRCLLIFCCCGHKWNRKFFFLWIVSKFVLSGPFIADPIILNYRYFFNCIIILDKTTISIWNMIDRLNMYALHM